MSKNKKILIINTGGTISSVPSDEGHAPKFGIVEQALKDMPEMKDPQMPCYDLIEYQPLIDSANISIQHWNQMAQDINKHYQRYDGFVILHGTDTMAYTASALSFMLENLAKPVIITGAQIPLIALRSDGRDNLINALLLAQEEALNEVTIFFEQQLLRGNRAQKVSAYAFSAFDSPNFQPLAKVGTHVTWQSHLLQKTPTAPFSVQPLQEHYIANIKVFPSFSTQVLKTLLNQPLKGLILETYGSGNAQNNDPTFLDIIRKATEANTILVNCSQCHQAFVNMDAYSTGHALKEAGVISGYNMTPETAYCKLLYVLSKNLTTEQCKQQLQTPLRGELDQTNSHR